MSDYIFGDMRGPTMNEIFQFDSIKSPEDIMFGQTILPQMYSYDDKLAILEIKYNIFPKMVAQVTPSMRQFTVTEEEFMMLKMLIDLEHNPNAK